MEGASHPPGEVAALASELLAIDDDAAAKGDDGTATATAVAKVFERVSELVAENEGLRAALAEERTTHLALLEANRELEWRVRTGVPAGAGAGEAQRDWEEMEAKLQLLLTENNLLEARERETMEELRHEQKAMAQLQTSHADALNAARQAADAADAADAAAREECEAAREASDAAREAQALAAASDLSLANLRNELAAARAELAAAHRLNAEQRTDVERLHAAGAMGVAEANERDATAKALAAEQERRLAEVHLALQKSEAAVAEARGAADGHAISAERMQLTVEKAQREATAQAAAAQESSRIAALGAKRETELEEQLAALSRRVEAQSEELSRQSGAAQRVAASSAASHNQALAEAQGLARREAQLCEDRELALQKVIEALRASLEKKTREAHQQQAALDAAVAAAAQAKGQLAEAAAGGNVALREEAMVANARAEEKGLEGVQLRAELKASKEEIVRLKASLDSRASELERSEVRARRALAQAESDRDAMGARMSQRGEAADRAMAEAAQVSERCRSEVNDVRRLARAEVDALAAELKASRSQLSESTTAAAGLQELLGAQQQVAEGYRAEAQRCLARLSQLETTQQPLQRTLASYREHEKFEREALAQQLSEQQSQLQRALSSSLAQTHHESLTDVSRGLDELRDELRSVRSREQEQSLAVQAARQLVS